MEYKFFKSNKNESESQAFETITKFSKVLCYKKICQLFSKKKKW